MYLATTNFLSVEYGVLLCIVSVSTLRCMYMSSSYATIFVGVGYFGFSLGTGSVISGLLGSFTLGYAVFMGVFLYVTSTLFCSVS